MLKNQVEHTRKQLTLCIIHTSGQVLLGMKKKGFGEWKWNGFGGKVEQQEAIEDAARRELFEEAGIQAHEIEKAGILHFEFQGDPIILEVHIFRSEDFAGELSESDEMRPQWFPVEHIPFDAMWPDDKYWFPLLLEKKKFKGSFLFNNESAIMEHRLEEVHDL